MKVVLLSEFVALVLATGCLPCALQGVGSLIPGFSVNVNGQASASGSLAGAISALVSAELQPYSLNCQVQGQAEVKPISVNADGTCGIQGSGTQVAFTYGQAFQWATGGLVCSVDREGGPIIVKPLKETPAMNIYHGWQAQAGVGGQVNFKGYDNYICHDKICAFPTGKAAPTACTPMTLTTASASPDVQPPPAQVPLAPLKDYTGQSIPPPVETSVHAPETHEPVPVGGGEAGGEVGVQAGGQVAGGYTYGTNGTNGTTTTTTEIPAPPPPGSEEEGSDLSGNEGAGTDEGQIAGASTVAGGGGGAGTGEGEDEDGLSGLSSSNMSASSLPANKKLSASNDASGIAMSNVWTVSAGVTVALLALVM